MATVFTIDLIKPFDHFGSGFCIGAFYLFYILTQAPGMYILGISAFFHDSAVCLLNNDKIVAAAQEERFTRIKNDAAFPVNAIRFCLAFAEIKLSEVDHVVFYEKPFLKFERLLETHIGFAPLGINSFLKSIPVWLKDKLFMKRNIGKKLKEIDPLWKGKNDILFTGHHQSHAASAFFPSPYKEAVILTVDGVGEWATTTIWKGSDNHIELIKEIKFPHSLGLLYAAFTAFLGFKVNSDEYKVMGLAAYGEPRYTTLIYENLITVKDDGSFWMDMHYFSYGAGLTMTNQYFDRLFNATARRPGEEVTAFHKDIACSIQKVTEEVMVKLTRSIYQQYPAENLCMAGGVALNCVINSTIVKKSGFRNIWIQPAAGDAGGAIGSAFTVYYEYLNNKRNIEAGKDKMQNSLLGPVYNEATVQHALIDSKLSFTQPVDFYQQVAKCLAEGKVVGYFSGRMEFGPRALGCRSILADPRHPDMQCILNEKIKLREGFRPFAPAILEEFVDEYFSGISQSPYMLFVAQTKADGIPAVKHVDGTARVQTVNSSDHPDFYRVIYAFYELTGCPLLINTSFNVMNEPVVCSPEDAIRCFKQTNMDVLAIAGMLIYK